jgi:NADH-ubiquinone oxidoreductase chain 6
MLNYIFLAANLGIFISALVLVTQWDPIKKLLALISLFIFSSFIFILLNFFFLGLTYLIVYIGAIAILFLFVIMMVPLDNWATDKLHHSHSHNSAHSLGTYFAIFFLASALAYSFRLNTMGFDLIFAYFNINWSDAVQSYSDIHVLAELLYIKWPLIIVLISYILWLILIGVLWITLA